MKKTSRGYGRFIATLAIPFAFVVALAGCDPEEPSDTPQMEEVEGAEETLAEEVATEAEAHEGLATSDEVPVDSVGGDFSLEEDAPCGASSSGCHVAIRPDGDKLYIFKCCGPDEQECSLTWVCSKGASGWTCDPAPSSGSGKSHCSDSVGVTPDGEGGMFINFYRCCEGAECTVTAVCHLQADGESTCYNYSPT